MRKLIITLFVLFFFKLSFSAQNPLGTDTLKDNYAERAKNETGVKFGLNFCRIYWNDNAIFSGSSRLFSQSGADISLYHNFRMSNAIALHLDIGVSLKREQVYYSGSTKDSAEDNNRTMIYTSKNEYGTLQYRSIFLPFDFAAQIYPSAESNFYFLTGVKPELALISKSTIPYKTSTWVYKKDSIPDKVINLSHSSTTGEKKGDGLGMNIYLFFGFGFTLGQNLHHPVRMEFDYLQSANFFRITLHPYHVTCVEIKVGLKI